ncbi:peptide chain release factor N(5)-glutamine methyltransferase [Starkeya sp. 3C]|uniref:Release factor glutamine methyltransferase n=1 Tax=Ancylobacter moscoviensis TaxID=2597768 RepID=A0ABY3DN29_9HYPH|nr:peptide chain release factor N(5)-glutamine methyltransferase [Ancylobacter moscoviensis]TSJ60639.1 peptide chain release factor N(5)-glutamine methyltransferase [Ancylobacter moscoviensis]
MTSRADLAREIAASFAAAGLETPEREARALLRAGLGLSDVDLLARADAAVPEAEAHRLRALAARRAAGEPLARLVGRREFWSLDFALAPETLVPRPETETLVEAALAVFPDRAAPLAILDLGTGSGALLAALLSEYPAAFGIGVDLSPGAARQARANLESLGLGARAAILVGAWADALAGRFDLVVSNPPYIPTMDIAVLDREVREHDPLLALDGGPKGLDAYRAIARALPGLLRPGGRAVLELGIGQEGDVAALLTAAGLAPDGPARRDLAGIARAIVTRPA